MIFDRYGKLAIRSYVAGGALPLANVIVTIRGASEENRDVQYSLVTDVDGLTPFINLPAPDKISSQSPGNVGYGLYDIEASAEGYYSKIIRSVAVFDGISTVLPINMIPSPIHENNEDYPRGNLDTLILENENLEG